jgi:hypothetical protein
MKKDDDQTKLASPVRNGQKLKDLPPHFIPTPKRFVTSVKTLQEMTLNQIFWLINCWSAFVMILFVLQGFHIGGFDLPVALLQWLGATVFASVATALVIAVKLLFTNRS